MAKQKIMDAHEADSWDEEIMDNEMYFDAFQDMLNTSTQHMSAALELTKIVLQYTEKKPTDENGIYAVFKRAMQTVSDNSPMKKMVQSFADNNVL